MTLTNIWKANDGGTYYIREIENENKVWWLGVSNKSQNDSHWWINIFSGTIKDATEIDGEWTDVPLGNTLNNGKLRLKIVKIDGNIYLQRIEESGGFGASAWEVAR